MTSQQVYSQSFGQRKDLQELYGSYVQFFYPYQDSTGLYNQEVYTDPNGTIYKFGEGPGQAIMSGANQTPIAGASTLAPSAISSAIASNPLLAQGQSLLTGSLIGGIPNWMLLIGVVGAFFIFGEESPDRHRHLTNSSKEDWD